MKNLHAEPLKIQHSQLKRWNSNSAYKSVCPACEQGVLLIVRDPKSLKLTRVDRCTACAQTVIYTDPVINGEPFHDSILN